MTNSESVRDAFHYLYPAELPFLKELVASLQDNPTVVNIGAGAGTSGLAILESRDDVILITIDPQDRSSPLGCLEGERTVVLDADFAHLHMNRWFQINARSQDVARDWGGKIYGDSPNTFLPFGEVDMVFIDGDHSYQGCADDIRGWLSHICPGGVIAVHDYDKQTIPFNPNGPHPQEWVGVNQAVNKFLLPNFSLIKRVDSLIAFVVP